MESKCDSLDRDGQMAGSKSTRLMYRGHKFNSHSWVLWFDFQSVENSLFENNLQALTDTFGCAVQSGPWRTQVPIGSFTFIAEITG